MTTPNETLWDLEPHTGAKHEILRRYLGAWFSILGQKNPHILYIDGFCGPGRYRGGEEGSPIIALKAALGQPLVANSEITFLFIDERPDRITHLESELKNLRIPSNYHIITIVNCFDNTLTDILNDLDRRGTKLAPTFAFVDPFGFKGAPFSLIQRLLQNPSTEIFINVMLDYVNRFLEHPDAATRQHIIELFGTPAVMQTVKSPNRLLILRQLYQQQLQRYARFVRYFEMCNDQNRVIYDLFFASNHALGHAKMKEAFWQVDAQSGYKFSDRTNPNQGVLFVLDPSQDVAVEIQRHFAGKTIFSEEIIRFVEDQTAYTQSQAKHGLQILEQDKKIEVESLKKDGTKRRKGSFPNGVKIRFVPI